MNQLLNLDPVATLLQRVRAELSADFTGAQIRLSRAPGRLDVMGGIADYTGSLVCEATLDRAAAVAMTTRNDGQVQVFSFNLYDEHVPFMMRIPVEALATRSIEDLRDEFAQPGRKWAGYLAGCLAILREQGYVDLKDVGGFNLAVLSTVPLGAGVSSSAAIEVATMMNFVEHFGIRGEMDPMRFSAMCQMVENRVVGAPCGIMDQVSSCAGHESALLRMICQPHELQEPLKLPEGVRALGINSNVKHSVGGGMYGKTRCAAFMGHRIILEMMAKSGRVPAVAREHDPLRGYLANLAPEEYERDFREHLPMSMSGQQFIEKFGKTFDSATQVEPGIEYHVRPATDHHVYEAARVRKFSELMEMAARLPSISAARTRVLEQAGELMYQSHDSYGSNAMLGAEECDLLVKLVRENASAGLYGAKITGGGSGGTVAVLADDTREAEAAVERIMAAYQDKTGNRPEAFLASSPGAWDVRTVLHS